MKVLDTNLMFAVRCANCGRIKFHSISTFQLLASGTISLYCDCGNTEMTVSLKQKKCIIVDVPCLACDVNHTYKYSFKDIFKKRITVICCVETGFELCFLGMESDVREVVNKYQEDLNKLLGELGLSNEIDKKYI